MILRIQNANRLPLEDTVDIDIFHWPSRQLVASVNDIDASLEIRVPDLARPLGLYQVQVWPTKYLPVGQFMYGDSNTTIYCPVDPKEVKGISVKIDGFSDLQAAALINIRKKLKQCELEGFVQDISKVEQDRIFAFVKPQLIETLEQSEEFVEVSGALHEPPPGFVSASSFKHTPYSTGILQITLFRSKVSPTQWLADIDIDDAGGVGHIFQVLDHWATQSKTNPYDIHQILTFDQQLDLGYSLLI